MGIDELCAFGFDRFWVSQALELTNNHKDYALEWLLSDEFKLSKQAMEEQKQKEREERLRQQRDSIVRPASATPTNKAPQMRYNNNNNHNELEHTPSPPPPPAFQMNEMAQLKQPPPVKPFVKPLPAYHSLSLALTDPEADECDYRVTFTSSTLGLLLSDCADSAQFQSESQCVVEQCLGKTAKHFVDVSSKMVAVGDIVVLGMAYAETVHILRDALKHPPLTLQLRTKMKPKKLPKNKKRRGFLKVKVVTAKGLRVRGSHCLVQVGNAKLSSAKLEGDTEVRWDETLIFKNFRPNEGKSAVITVYSETAKCVGRCECVLPTQFNRLCSEARMLRWKDELCGAIQVHIVLVEQHTT